MVQCMFCMSSSPDTVASSSHILLDYKCKDFTRTHVFTIILKRKAQTKLKLQLTLLYDDRWHKRPYSHYLLEFYMLLLLLVSLISSFKLYQSLCHSFTPTLSTRLEQLNNIGNQENQRHLSQSLCNFTSVSFWNLYFDDEKTSPWWIFTKSLSREVNSIIWNNNKGYYLHDAFGENKVVVKVVKVPSNI